MRIIETCLWCVSSDATTLELTANRKGENLQQPVIEAPVPPPLEVNLSRVRQIVGEDLLEVADNLVVVNDRVDLVVEGE